ncbi:MAG: hypothetical protein H0X29_03790 [Parachlamydiaceae bacterium]|nr:hypothetical protein [Parachlamydiaceae bacterium]
MNKIIFTILFSLLFLEFSALKANETSVEIRSAAFFHSSKLFREIYGNVSGSYQLEVATQLNQCVDGWANFDWFTKHGRSNEFNDPTRVNIANFSLGIKYPYQFCQNFSAYIGIGPSFSTIWLKNKSECNHSRTSRLAVGGILKTGIIYSINRCFFVDLFVDYLYQPVHFDRRVDIGGFKTGAGIGVKF